MIYSVKTLMKMVGVVTGGVLSNEDKRYLTVSLPRGIAVEIDRLIEELGYWPSRGAFAREACLEKIREEKQIAIALTEILHAPSIISTTSSGV
jgi:Arc/MetJ-type ribon-helix-helix transcriptional regulator